MFSVYKYEFMFIISNFNNMLAAYLVDSCVK